MQSNLAPADNPDFPSYESISYREMFYKLEFVEHMWRGRESWFSLSTNTFHPLFAARYLPQENEELDEQYRARVQRSFFEHFFRDTIQTFAGFLADFVLAPNAPDIISKSMNNIDKRGNSIAQFLKAADEMALRDGHCFIFVDAPLPLINLDGTPLISNYREAIEFEDKIRPYFCVIDRRNVINWALGENREIIRATIREYAERPIGRYGSEIVERFRVLSIGYFEVYEYIEGEFILVEEGYTSLNCIPLVIYSSYSELNNLLDAPPPFYDIAELNLKHYQKASEKDELMHKVNMPILSLKKIGTNNLPKNPKNNDEEPKVTIGPNTCLWNVDAAYIEPTGSALATIQKDIEKLEEAIKARSLSFLTGNQYIKTATEVAAFSSSVQATVNGMAESKESAVQQAFYFAAKYLDPNVIPEGVGGIAVDRKVLQSALDISVSNFLLNLRSNNYLSIETFLNLLKQGKVLPKDFDVEKELKAIVTAEIRSDI